MILLQDQEGRVTSTLCFLLLLTYHASRDALITALPTIGGCTKTNNSDIYRAYAVGGPLDRLINSPLRSATQLFPPGGQSSNSLYGNIGDPDPPGTRPKETIGIAEQDDRPTPWTIVIKPKDGKFIFDQITEDILAYQRHLDSLDRDVNIDDYGPDEDGFQVQRKTRQQPRPLNHLFPSEGRLSEVYSFSSDGSTYDAKTELCSDIEYAFGYLQYKAGWSMAVQGSVLCVLHWLTIPGLFLGYYCAESSRVSEGVVTAVFALQWGALAILTQLFEGWGPVALTAVRAWQGLAQGACYPCLYRLLEARSIHSRTKLVIIFTGVWLGSALGTSLGTFHSWYIPFYVAGGLAFAVGLMLPFLAPGPKRVKNSCPWRLVLQRDVVVSAMMHGGGVWVLHTLLIVPTMVVLQEDRWWVLIVVVTAGGATSQLLEAGVEYFVPYRGQPARGHLLSAMLIGFCISASALIVVATKGSDIVDKSSGMVWVLLGATFGTMFGTGVTSIGYRQVLEAASPTRRSQALVFVNGAGAAGAGLASFLLPTMTQAGGYEGFVTACLLPLSLMVAATVCAFFFLLFPTRKEDDQIDGQQGDEPRESGVYVIPLSNGHAGGGVFDGFSQRSGDNKSFRSLKSLNSFKSFKSAVTTASFKSAGSRPRARTSSFNTVLEVEEDDLQSIPDDNSVDCRSVLPDTEDDMQSLASVATSFRSMTSPRTRGVVLSTPSMGDLMVSEDHTSAWLHLHHQVDVRPPPTTYSPDQEASSLVYPLPGLLV